MGSVTEWDDCPKCEFGGEFLTEGASSLEERGEMIEECD